MVMNAFKSGVLITAGLVGHKLLTGLVRDMIFKPAVETVEESSSSETVTAGLGQVKTWSSVIVGAGVAVAGILAANKLIKTAETRRLVQGGIAASFIHTLIVNLLDMWGQPEAAGVMSGLDDGTAARISAMYGLGRGTSIQPEYAPIGEYFNSGVQGMGEYFAAAGLGEYFNSGVQGLGAVKPYEASAGVGANYGMNPDLYQAAAGLGNEMQHQGNHIDPSSDLDRELTIAEAAAGVGASVYQAAAGFGATPVRTVPRSSTWIPGMSDAPIWAGVRAIDDPQSRNELLTAGVLQTDGGQGVFGGY